jgi:murein DD-endopeptidase MepM/ murein hydrolase activator NlpD
VMIVAKLWNRWRNRSDSRDSWAYHDEGPDLGWLKRTLAAIVIFLLVYGAHISGTAVGTIVDSGVHYALNTETDWSYLADKVSKYVPPDLDLAMFKKVQTTVSKPADPLMYMTRPVDGKIAADFGWQTHPILKQEMMHEGVDFEAPIGTNVQASAPGKVVAITDSAKHGKVVIVEHSQEVSTVYGHLGEVLVKEGEAVSQGQVIAKVGKSGMTKVPLLYFEVRENGKPVDPATRLKGDLPSGERK